VLVGLTPSICVITDLYLTRPPGAWRHCANTSYWEHWSRHHWPWGPHGPTPQPSSSGRPDGGGAAWHWMSSPSTVMATSWGEASLGPQ
jgi:hypothetical protein